MSLRSIIEFSLHLDHFRNIDLFHQGIYKLKISLLKNAQPAYPYNLATKHHIQLEDPHNLTPSSLEETHIESKSFLVRYFDELVRIDEVFYFRIEVDYDISLQDSYFSLVIELFFTDLGGKLSTGLIKPVFPCKFEKISSCEYLLKYPNIFQTIYIPVVFDDNHCCLVSAMISYLVIDYKFRPIFSRTLDINEALASRIFKLGHKSGREYIGSSMTDKTYNSLMDPLCKTYRKLREFYLSIIQKCLSETQKHLFNLYYVPPILSLPGGSANNKPAFPGDDLSDDSVGEGSTSECKFSQRIASHDAKKIASAMMAELSMVSGQIFQLWHRMQETIPNCIQSIFSMVKEKHSISQRQALSHGLIRKVVKSPDLGISADSRKVEQNKFLAAEKRRKNSNLDHKKKRLINKNFDTDFKNQPILIEEFCILDGNFNSRPIEICGVNSSFFSRERQRDGFNHLVVLVHGFQGSSSDMRIVKNILYINFPNNLYLCSSCNERNTESSIFSLGQKLAGEVRTYLTDNCITNLGRVSFIGHSLGGLIIRAALPYLEDLSHKMHLFLTFSSPHLGIIEGSSKLIRAGLWVLNNFKKCESLKQLSFSDCLKIEDCALFELAKLEVCKWFSHFVLISSPQDLYSPHYSARIEITKDLERFGENAKMIQKMARNIVEGRERIHRIDVDFYLPSANFDSLIGRAGHIEFLENHTFMKSLSYLHPEFFE